MSFFQTINSSLRRMPWGLRLVTKLCLIFTLFIPVAFLPFGMHSVNGVQVSFAEFWRQGGGPVFVGIGLVSILIAYGFIRKQRWARPIAVAIGWAMMALNIIGIIENCTLTPNAVVQLALSFLFGGCLPIWYLYFRHMVKEYFGEVKPRHED